MPRCHESLLLCLLLTVAVLLLGAGGSSSEGEDTLGTVLSCLRREYTLKATRTDRHGRTCWDLVKATSCWGRCDSFEIPDWRFPFKISHHPVCQHDRRVRRRVQLRHCDPGAHPDLRTYEFYEARTCACAVCNSSETFCDWRSHHHHHHNHNHHHHSSRMEEEENNLLD